MILALDVSTSCIGYALFDETGETNKERSSENSQGVEVRAIFVVGFFWFY